MKPDEVLFLKACQAQCENRPGRRLPRDVYGEIGMNWKRACAILAKWSRKGWYDYGVNVDLGWMTKLGMEASVPSASREPE